MDFDFLNMVEEVNLSTFAYNLKVEKLADERTKKKEVLFEKVGLLL